MAGPLDRPGPSSGGASLKNGRCSRPGWTTTQVQQLENYTFQAESSLAFRLSEVVSLKMSVRDNFDSGAKDRGAVSNNDGRVLFSVLAALMRLRFRGQRDS